MACCCCASPEGLDAPVELDDIAQSADFDSESPPEYRLKQERSCTDVLCLLLFTLCLLGLGVVFYLAVTTGDPYTLLHPTDSQGNLCGHSNATKQQKFLMFFDLIECLKMGPTEIVAGGCPTRQVCVSSCPRKNWVWTELWLEESQAGRDPAKRKKDMVCTYGDPQNDTALSVRQLVSSRKCAPYYLNSTSIAGRCIPSIFKTGVQLLKKIVTESGDVIRTADNETEVRFNDITQASGYLGIFLSTITVAQNAFHDVVSSRYLILAGIGIGAMISFVWCVLLRITAAIMVYGSLLMFFLTFAAAAGYCFTIYLTDSTLTNFSDEFGVSYFTTNFSLYLRVKETWLVLGITASVAVLLVLVLLLFLRNRLRLAIAIIREASKAIATMPSTLLFPVWPLLVQVVVVVLFAANAALLASSGRRLFAETNSTTRETQSCDPGDGDFVQCQFLRYGGNDYVFYLQAFNLFMAFWISAFVIAFSQLVLAGAFASYYWTWDKQKGLSHCALMQSACLALRYHIGTVAFGSLLIAIVKMIRAVITYLQSKLEEGNNTIVRFLFRCLQCCFWLLEKFLKYLSKNAYIVTAITGKNFCLAAKSAFGIILQNCLRFAVVDNVCSFVLLIGKLVVTLLVSGAAALFFQSQIRFNFYFESLAVDLHYFFVPVILIGLATYIICSIFFSVFDFAVDTMLLCAMVDEAKNDGSKEKPYFMSKSLRKILDASNDFVDQRKKG